MSSYRRPRLLFNALRRAISGTPVHEFTPIVARNPSPSSSSSYSTYNSRVSGFSRSSLFSSIFSHIRPKGGGCTGPRVPPRRLWFRNTVLTVAVGSGVLITGYFWMSETIPYTNRTQLVRLSRSKEKEIGERKFEKLKKTLEFRGKILPAMHPQCVRLKKITNDIVKALQRGPSHERSPWYAALMEIIHWCWGKDDGGLNWEVLVVNEPYLDAFCFPGGKIVVSLGLLQFFTKDSEIATIIGHEVGHIVARHAAEQETKDVGNLIFSPNLIFGTSNLLLPSSKRMEIEADYIGILLMASAGYDPRIAPKVYEQFGRIEKLVKMRTWGDSKLEDHLSTHPSSKKRALFLAQSKVMEEAMSLYCQS